MKYNIKFCPKCGTRIKYKDNSEEYSCPKCGYDFIEEQEKLLE